MRADRNLAKYESLEAFANGHLHALQRFGKDPASLLEVPAKPDDEKGWGELFNKLGRPETADGYKLDLDEGASDADKAFADGFKAIAHKAGLSQAQMGAAVGYLNETIQKAHQEAAEAAKAAAAECQKVLGAAWGDKKAVYETEIPKLLGDLGEKLKIEGVFDKLNAQGLGSSPELLQILAAVTDMRAEPGALPGAGAGEAGRPATPYQAQAALSALHGDPAKLKALQDRNDPLHKTVLAEREALLKQAYPAGQ
ncbi:hypothetical protein EV278_107198 [Caulobacter sp. BK020]|nr:hypothetical protein EV278_107198 [Caulobacter sp. BK020]